MQAQLSIDWLGMQKMVTRVGAKNTVESLLSPERHQSVSKHCFHQKCYGHMECAVVQQPCTSLESQNGL